MTRFQCIADQCEDTCCSGLKVVLGEADHQRLQKAMSQTLAERERFDRLVERTTPASEGFATLRKTAGGSCAALTENRLCSLHRDYGAQVLANVCASFPRLTTPTHLGVELAGTLACPEVARLCLLAPDGLETTGPVNDPGGWCSEGVRILGMKQVRWRSRLALLGYLSLANEEQGAFFEDPKNFASLLTSLDALAAPADSHRGLWGAILAASTRGQPGRLGTFVSNLDLSQVIDVSAVLSSFSTPIEQYFRHHAVHFWLRYAQSASSRLTLALELVARSVLAEFVFWRNRALGSTPSHRELDAVAVEVIQTCSRYVFPQEPFQSWLRSVAGGNSTDVLGRLVALSTASVLPSAASG